MQDSNGNLSALNAFMQQKFKSAAIYNGSDLKQVYLSRPNVQMVQSVLSQEQWNYLFPFANQIYDYQSFLMAVAKFPAFCLEGDANLCKRELSTFFAQTTHECGMEESWQAIPTWRQGFYYITEKACTPQTGAPICDYKSDGQSAIWWPPRSGVQYFGRGPFQLSWNYNYGQFSTAEFGDQNVLLANPDLVGKDGYTAFSSAMWFYMTPQAPKPSMHEIATKLYVPSAYDVSQGLGSVFGATTMVINGGLECTTPDGQENGNSQLRSSYY